MKLLLGELVVQSLLATILLIVCGIPFPPGLPDFLCFIAFPLPPHLPPFGFGEGSALGLCC